MYFILSSHNVRNQLGVGDGGGGGEVTFSNTHHNTESDNY